MMCRWQFQVAIGDSVPKLFLSGTILVRDSEAGVGTELAVVQKYGKQDSSTTEYLPSRRGNETCTIASTRRREYKKGI